MKLAYLVSRYPAANHTYVLREVRQLRQMGFDIAVASVSPDGRPLDALTPDEVAERQTTFVVKSAGARAIAAAHLRTAVTRPRGYVRGLLHAVRLGGADLRQIAYNLVYFAEAVVVGRWMEERGLRRVHTHYATQVTLFLSRVFPVHTSATIHGSAEFVDPGAGRLAEKIASATFVCAISQYGVSQLMKASPPGEWAKFELTPLGVECAPVAGPRPRRGGGPFGLTCVGQLQPAKGQHVLLDALALLVRSGQHVHLTLVGDGPDRDALVAHAHRVGVADAVTFTGTLNQKQVGDVYARTDAFVLASFAEGVPVVLMEAMAACIPCVATRITGIPELIRDGTDGLLVTPSSASELAAAVARLVDDPALCERLGAAGRARVVDRYDLQKNVALFGSVLRRRYDASPVD